MTEDRNLFFEYRNRPTHKAWGDAHADLELRIRAIIDRIRGAVTTISTSGDPVTVKHRVLQASLVGTRVIVDFRVAQKYTLILDANVAELVFIPAVLAVNRAASFQIEVIQAGGGSKLITAWSNVVFYASTTSFYSGGLPVLSTTAGYVDVVAFSYNAWDNTLRGMYTPGATS